uniref:Uncharacterized protein n=1 Tax=Lepeophtheirus salmonis TaxID=72036 RepID=A0A0K2UJG7_LEPSM
MMEPSLPTVTKTMALVVFLDFIWITGDDSCILQINFFSSTCAMSFEAPLCFK